MKEKYFPEVGTPCYIQKSCGYGPVDEVRHPYTVVQVTKTKVVLQECRLIFPVFKYDPATMSNYYKQFDGKRTQFYDTLPETIEPDPQGRQTELFWKPKHGCWGTKGDYPSYGHFGAYDYVPYTN